MMRFQAGRLVAALAPLFLVAACAMTEPTSTQTLNDRMQARLAPEIAANQVAVQPLLNGTQVIVSEQSLFAPGGAQLDDKGRAVLTYVIQALLEPTILTIQVSDASDALQGARAEAVAAYFRNHSLGPQVQPIGAPGVVPVGAAGTPVQGMTITVNVVAG